MNIHGFPFGKKISFHGGLSTSMLLFLYGGTQTLEVGIIGIEL